MKIKNTGATVMNIGKTVILPGEVAEVTDPAYVNNPVVDYFVATKRLAIVKDIAKTARTEPKTAAKEPDKVEDKPEPKTAKKRAQKTTEG